MAFFGAQHVAGRRCKSVWFLRFGPARRKPSTLLLVVFFLTRVGRQGSPAHKEMMLNTFNLTKTTSCFLSCKEVERKRLSSAWEWGLGQGEMNEEEL